MATVFYKIWKPIAKHKIIASLLVIAAVGYSVYAGTKPTNADTQYILTSVKKGTIVASVSGSGEVAATNQLDLVPQGSGTIVSIKVKAGDQVKQGQVIAVLDQKNAFVSLKQAQASVDSAKANLEKVQAGTASTDIQTAQNSVNAAQESLTNAEQNLTQVQATQDLVVKNAYTNMMNAGLAPAAGASNRTTAVPTIAGAYTGTDQGSYKISLYQTEAGLHYSVSGLETGDGLFSPGMIAIGTHGLYLNFPAGNYFDGDYWTIDIPNLKSSTYLSASNAYETAKQSRISAEQTAQNQIDTATLNLQQTQTALAAKMTPPNPADVAAAKAQVDSALVQLQNAQNNYQNTIVKAPFDGKIASVNVQAGSQAGASTSIATLITNQLYASIPFNEVDVAKIQLGQKATLTFDAMNGLTITGTVSQIQAVGTVTQGVVNYTVQISLDTQDARIKPGMSTSASVVTNTRQDVLMLPNSAVKTQGGQSFVQVISMPAGTDPSASQIATTAMPVRVPVTIGLADGNSTEILSGLNEGDRVILQTINPNAKTTTSSIGGGGAGGIRIPGITGGGGGFRGN